jgi:alkylation response protein AidB-like acyl-CoA dehydrogenase
MSQAEHVDLDMVADSARAFVAGNAGPARARQRMAQGPGWLDADCWRGMAGLGWFGIAAPESAGGLELGAGAACVVAEEAGRALLVPPLTAAMAAASLLAASSHPAAAQRLGGLLDGSEPIALVRGDARHGLDSAVSFDADAGGTFLVANQAGDAFELRVVSRAAPGVEARHDACVDGSFLSRLRIDGGAWSDAPRVLHGRDGQKAWDEAMDLLRLTDAAYLCGVMGAALAMGLDYLRLRHQFGVPIGSFQALQHRAADCHVQWSSARALVQEAATAYGTPKGRFAAAASIQRAKAAALHVTKENIQFHGAIGFADEHDAGLYLRRAMVLAARHSDSMQVLRECRGRS